MLKTANANHEHSKDVERTLSLKGLYDKLGTQSQVPLCEPARVVPHIRNVPLCEHQSPVCEVLCAQNCKLLPYEVVNQRLSWRLPTIMAKHFMSKLAKFYRQISESTVQ